MDRANMKKNPRFKVMCLWSDGLSSGLIKIADLVVLFILFLGLQSLVKEQSC
jgi:hypothetical protein